VTYPTVELQKDLGRHLRLGHPWVFAKALAGRPSFAPGTIVDVQEGGRFVARGYFDPASPIRVRVLTRDPAERVDALFFRRRVARAALLRAEVVAADPSVDSYRVVHGENDGLPGLVVDRYAGFLVTKLYSAGLVPYRDAIVDALRAEVPGVRGVFGREDLGRDDDEGESSGPPSGRVHWGEAPPDRIAIHEHGATFLVDVRGGQKTGFFLDQRENRLATRRYARGREALNCFGFTGGFSVHLALGGARKVTTLDLDADALALARDNFAANGLDPEAHGFVRADVFDWLASAKREGRTFDLVILDPPAFAKSQKAVEAALDGYASLNRAALAVLRPGGFLVTCSCSARVSAEEFAGAVAQGAAKAKVDLQLVETRHQPPDHPVALGFREGRYLKALFLRRV
jgi:23S rRNA (cytosine1962-C5)-methyltransferase